MSVTVEQRNVSGIQPRPTLTLADAMAMIVGIVIGAGIFRAPSIVAGNVASETAFLLLWIAGGVVSLIGALCYAELGSAFPSAGGEYYFLRRAFGGWPAFLFAWARMSVVQTGAIAAIAFAFGDYASQVWSLGARSSAWYAAGAVLAITALNVSGTTRGKWLQNILTAALAIGMMSVVVAGAANPPPPAAAATPSSAPWFSGLAIIFVMLTYGGWNEAAYLTAEIRDARRNVVRALVGGLLVVTILYVLMNFAYVRVLGLDGMRQSKAVAADLMKVAFSSDTGAVVLSIIVIAATLSTLNATVFTGARTNYAVGRDYRMFRWLGFWTPGANAPVNALLWQGAIALALVYFASSTKDGFETLVAYTAPAFWLFFLLTAISLFILRKQPPNNPSPFRVPLYPLTPLIFCGMCGYMLWKSVEYAMSLDSGSVGARLGIAVLLAGVPLMLLAQRAGTGEETEQRR